MDLFEVKNRHAYPSVHALMIEPYKTMWENDTSDSNEEVIKKFSYIELMCSLKKSNPYSGLSEDIREKKVKKEVWGDPEYELPMDVIEGVMKYKELLLMSSPGYDLYLTAVNTAQGLKRFLDDFDLADSTNYTKSGSMILKPKDLTNTLKDVLDTIKSLSLSRDKVLSELTEDFKTRNQREINSYEE